VKPALLFLAHRIPYPPNKGDKIRSFHLLEHLAPRYRVFLGAFADDADDEAHAAALADYCEEVHVVPLSPGTARLRSLAGLLSSEALTLPYYRDRGLARWVEDCRERAAVGRVLVFSSAMAQYVLGESWSAARRVVDFVDVDSDKWRQYAPTRRWPMRWVYAREAERLLDVERTVIATCDAGVFVSPAEAELFRSLAPEYADKVTHLNNGVDLTYFSPEVELPNPYERDEKAIVFVGAMDYWPNVDAVDWFAREVFPRVRQAFPAARFHIVGGKPTPAVQALAKRDGVVVTGRVADVRPYVRHAEVSVAPLRIARGIQNKVLESMAMGSPTVVSEAALEGIDAEPGVDVLVARDAVGFGRAVTSILNDAGRSERLRRNGRRCVDGKYDWSHSLCALDELFESSGTESHSLSATRTG
jgi:sugar transferase (PEP-CTERM/EpsH1 system associated)